jgi:hypothetical protein
MVADAIIAAACAFSATMITQSLFCSQGCAAVRQWVSSTDQLVPEARRWRGVDGQQDLISDATKSLSCQSQRVIVFAGNRAAGSALVTDYLLA